MFFQELISMHVQHVFLTLSEYTLPHATEATGGFFYFLQLLHVCITFELPCINLFHIWNGDSIFARVFFRSNFCHTYFRFFPPHTPPYLDPVYLYFASEKNHVKPRYNGHNNNDNDFKHKHTKGENSCEIYAKTCHEIKWFVSNQMWLEATEIAIRNAVKVGVCTPESTGPCKVYATASATLEFRASYATQYAMRSKMCVCVSRA